MNNELSLDGLAEQVDDLHDALNAEVANLDDRLRNVERPSDAGFAVARTAFRLLAVVLLSAVAAFYMTFRNDQQILHRAIGLCENRGGIVDVQGDIVNCKMETDKEGNWIQYSYPGQNVIVYTESVESNRKGK